MIQKIKEIIKSWSTLGIHFPFAHDSETNKGSATLLFYYVFSLGMMVSLFALHFKEDLIKATLTTMGVWVVSYVCYRLRKIDKLKLDIQNQSIEIDTKDDSI